MALYSTSIRASEKRITIDMSENGYCTSAQDGARDRRQHCTFDESYFDIFLSEVGFYRRSSRIYVQNEIV